MYTVIQHGNTFIARDSNGLEYEIGCQASERELRDRNISTVVADAFNELKARQRLGLSDLGFIALALRERTGIPFEDFAVGKNNLRIWIGQRIETARLQAELSEDDLADACGMPVRTLRKIEAGKYSADLETIQNITENLGCTIDLISR